MKCNQEAYEEDAISAADALAASECYLLRPAGSGYTASIYTGVADGVRLVSLHEIQELFSSGVLIAMADPHGF